MYTSEESKVTKNGKWGLVRVNLTGFVILTVFCVVFNFVYGKFSHGVSSDYMTYAFLIPLWGGVVPYFALILADKKIHPNHSAYNLYNSGIVTFTVGSLFQGVLEIYGTTNELVYVYVIAGVSLIFFGVVLYLEQIVKYFKKKSYIDRANKNGSKKKKHR